MKDSLVIEVGKTYLTRSGRKARVISTDVRATRSVVVCIDRGNVEVLVALLPNGRYADDFNQAADLIKEYVEPPKPRELLVLFHSDGLSVESAYLKHHPTPASATPYVFFREVLPE